MQMWRKEEVIAYLEEKINCGNCSDKEYGLYLKFLDSGKMFKCATLHRLVEEMNSSWEM